MLIRTDDREPNRLVLDAEDFDEATDLQRLRTLLRDRGVKAVVWAAELDAADEPVCVVQREYAAGAVPR